MSTLRTTSSTNLGSISASLGDTYYETTNNRIVVWNGTNWSYYNNDGTIAPFSYSNDNSVTLDGSDDQITLGNSSTTFFDFGTSDFTMSIWFKPSSLATYMELWQAHTSSAGGWLMYLKSNGTLGMYGDNTSLSDSSGTVSTGTWNHGVVSRSTNKLNIYLNGNKVLNKTISTSATFNKGSGHTVAIGNGGTNAGYAGLVDEPSIWKSALTDGGVASGTAGGEIATLYNSGTPGDISTLGNSGSGPDAWWRCGENNSGSGTTDTAQVGSIDGSLDNGASFSTTVDY